MERFAVEQVMERIRREIKDQGMCSDELSYISPYHRKMIKKLKTYSELIIFGAGIYGKSMLEDMEQHGISTIKCFCDNSTKVIGTEIEGYKVMSPENALKTYPDACFVITPKGSENEILAQLVHLGAEIENILILNFKLTGLEIE